MGSRYYRKGTRERLLKEQPTCRRCGWPHGGPSVDRGHAYRDGNGMRRWTKLRMLEIDHIIPVTRGGTNAYENLQILCNSCNASKGNRLPT